jgi:hypothetical protein
MRPSSGNGFEWRATYGSLRWLILGTLGLGPACGGRTVAAEEAGPSEIDSTTAQGSGGVAGSAMSSAAGAGGADGTLAQAGAGALAGAGGARGSQPSACVFEASAEGGLEVCQNGLLHRVSTAMCGSMVPRPDPIPDSERYTVEDGYLGACQRDTDCTEQSNGYCEMGQAGPYCRYGCRSDADCAADHLCQCGVPVGLCVPASCRTDSECGSGYLCVANTTCYTTTFVCQRAGDQCAVSSDCAGERERCVYEPNPEDPAAVATFVCKDVQCPIIGRPFLVDGAARLASPVQRADWYRGESTAPAALPPQLARAVAEGWTEQALMEHASVAAFARFALQLLSLGAPARLVEDTARAMQDEICHARDCFRLARRYLAADLGPGALPVQDALAHTSLLEIVRSTVLEGCIGETVAALEASEALAHCTDPDARAVLERIAVEEAEHAQLAWRFVAWALEAAPAAERAKLRLSVEQTFRDELAAPIDPGAIGDFDRDLARHGLLSRGLRQALRERVLVQVVSPCAERLLAVAAQGRRATSSPAGGQRAPSRA